jgi:Protein of unknown function (DUF3429)
VPVLAVLLGVAGLIPFLVCGIGAVGTAAPTAQGMTAALVGYSAVTLSFLGAVQWGLAMAPDARFQQQRLLLGVMPALVGWAALVLNLLAPSLFPLALLIAGFILTIGLESQAGRAGLLPRGYLTLRWGLTVVVVAILAIVLLLRLVGVQPFKI